MFIAFEGPDNVGKSTSAAELDAAGQPDYQVTKEVHELNRTEMAGSGLYPHSYDRIDWLSHMVYRLALPENEWNDARVRTVFGMPDTHLVFKIHRPDQANFIADEAVHTPIALVNPVYWMMADTLLRLNAFQGFNLFKSISVMEVWREGSEYKQHLVTHENAVFGRDTATEALSRMVTTNSDLLSFLQDVERRTS